MTKRRMWLAIAWVATTILVTSWVAAQTENVSAGNALLVGVVAASVLTAMVSTIKRGS